MLVGIRCLMGSLSVPVPGRGQDHQASTFAIETCAVEDNWIVESLSEATPFSDCAGNAQARASATLRGIRAIICLVSFRSEDNLRLLRETVSKAVSGRSSWSLCKRTRSPTSK
jgi:hypothetical protein